MAFPFAVMTWGAFLFKMGTLGATLKNDGRTLRIRDREILLRSLERTVDGELLYVPVLYDDLDEPVSAEVLHNLCRQLRVSVKEHFKAYHMEGMDDWPE